MSNRAPSDPDHPGLLDAPFEEKSVWIQLVSLLVILGGYLVVAGTMLANGVRVLGPFVPLFVVATVFLIIAMAVGHAVAAIVRRPEARDERDRLIAWRAESNASWVVSAGAFLAISGLVFGVGAVWIAHLLLLSMFVSELLKCTFQILYYRRGV